MKRLVWILGAGLVVAVALAIAISRTATYDWQLPADLPAPKVPPDNPMSDTKVELGRWLFYDTRLSGNNTMSCGTCHIQGLAFTDGKAQAVGSTNVVHPRSSMSLVNTAYASRLTWANPLLNRLEDQALTPLLGDKPVEMGMAGRETEIGVLLQSDKKYRELAQTAFPNDESVAIWAALKKRVKQSLS